MKIEAVIFDFDGVIADTMHDNFKAWERVFGEYQASIQAVDYYLLEGMGRYEIAEFFVEKNKLDKDLVETLVQKKELYYKQSNNFRVYDEIPQILDFLKTSGTRIGLVTGASRDRIESTLGALRSYFDIIVTSDEVQNGKPHPEPYLKAIGKLNCTPAHTIVIENAKLGIQSAKAAGCICLAVETTLGSEFLTEADNVFNNHQRVLNHLTTNYEYSKN